MSIPNHPASPPDIPALRARALNLRRKMMSMASGKGEGYIAQGLGIADCLAAIYFHELRYDSANPKWAEPQFKIAALETDPGRKIARLKMAASLAPRNAVYWQTLATAQAAANLFADAAKSWTAAAIRLSMSASTANPRATHASTPWL